MVVADPRNRLRRLAVCLFGAALLLGALAPSPLAQDAATPKAVIVDDEDDFDLTQQDDGSWKTTVGLTNTTLSEIAITGAKTRNIGDKSCTVTPAKDKLPAQKRTEVDVAISASCTVRDSGFDFLFQSSEQIEPIVAAPSKETPEWDELSWGFGLGAVLALALILIAQCRWYQLDRKEEKELGVKQEDRSKHKPWMPLSQLADTWSFSESWVANLTIAGALLVSLLGNTEVIKAALGDDSEPAIALVTVSAAVGAAFVAAGQIWLLAWKKRRGGGWKKKGWITVWGLYGGAVLTLTGAFGQMWVVWKAAENFKLGSAESMILPFTIAAAALLAVYAVRTLLLILEMGTNAPDAAAIADSRLLVAATLRGQSGVGKDDLAETIEEMETELKRGTPKQRREKLKQVKEAKRAGRPPPPKASLPAGAPGQVIAAPSSAPGKRSPML